MRVVGVREPFAMATPDYLEQVVISGRRRAVAGGAPRVRSGILYRPSVTSLIRAALDLLTVAIAAVFALRFRVIIPSDVRATSLPMFFFHAAQPKVLAY